MWMDKQTVVQYNCRIYSGILLNNNKERTTNTSNNMDELQNNYAEWNEPDQKKKNSLYDSIYKRIIENAN